MPHKPWMASITKNVISGQWESFFISYWPGFHHSMGIQISKFSKWSRINNTLLISLRWKEWAKVPKIWSLLFLSNQIKDWQPKKFWIINGWLMEPQLNHYTLIPKRWRNFPTLPRYFLFNSVKKDCGHDDCKPNQW